MMIFEISNANRSKSERGISFSGSMDLAHGFRSAQKFALERHTTIRRSIAVPSSVNSLRAIYPQSSPLSHRLSHYIDPRCERRCLTRRIWEHPISLKWDAGAKLNLEQISSYSLGRARVGSYWRAVSLKCGSTIVETYRVFVAGPIRLL